MSGVYDGRLAVTLFYIPTSMYMDNFAMGVTGSLREEAKDG